MIKKSILYWACILIYGQCLSQNWEFVSPQVPSGSGAQFSFDTSGRIYIKYMDDYSGQWEIRKMNGSSWTNVGTAENYVTTEFPYRAKGVQCTCPPLCQCGWSFGVQWFDGNNWSWVGDSAVLGLGLWYETSVKVDLNGAPYLMALNNSGWQLTLLKYNGSSWNIVGVPGFASALNPALTFDKNGTPYVVFEDLSYGNRTSIMKFDGSNWVYVGNPGAINGSVSGAYAESRNPMLIDTNGTIYLAYSAPFNFGGRVSVISYDGSSYNFIGAQGVSPTRAAAAMIAFDANHDLYLTYSENSGGLSVRKFDNGNWIYIGEPHFRQSAPITFTFDKNNIPYISHGKDYISYGSIRRYDSSHYFNIVSYSPDTICEGNSITIKCSSNIPFDTSNYFKLYLDPCAGGPYCYSGYLNLLSDSVYSNVSDTFALTFQIPHRTLDDTVNGNTAFLPLCIFSSNPYSQSQSSNGTIQVVKGPDFTNLPNVMAICQDSAVTLNAGLASSQTYQWLFTPGDSLLSTAQSFNFHPWSNGNLILTATFVATGCVNSDTSQISNVIGCTTGVEHVASDVFQLYPNPTTNELFIETNSISITEINIYNTTGNLVSQTKQPQNKSIDISGLTSGVYIAEVKTKEVSVKKRWVKM